MYDQKILNNIFMGNGFIRVAAAVPRVNVADCEGNANSIIEEIKKASERRVKILVLPELCVTSYTCGDLFGHSKLLDGALAALDKIRKATTEYEGVVMVGAPLRCKTLLLNCAIAIEKGKYVAVTPKTYLPNYKEFYDKRWFASGDETPETTIDINGEEVALGSDIMLTRGDVKIAMEVCEDLWTPIPPSSTAAINGANVIVNLSASNALIGKNEYRLSLIQQQSARCLAAYVYSSCGLGESTTDIVFAGNAIVAENGKLMGACKRFCIEPQMTVSDIDIERLDNERRTTGSFGDSLRRHAKKYREIALSFEIHDEVKLEREVAKHPFVPSDDKILNDRCEEIVNIQVHGLMRRLSFTGIKSVVIGVSGGLDSTLALLVAHRTFKKMGLDVKGIIGITMPGLGTTDRTHNNALELMKALGITILNIPIDASVQQHFKDIGQDPNKHDVTFENCQARERTQILMDYSNKCGGLVIGTGDLSELALGWATYNGDHMSMYAVNVSIPKTLVKYLVRWFAVCGEDGSKGFHATLRDIVETPISPELTPADENGEIQQKTEDLVGPYELHDFFIYYTLRHGFGPKKIFLLAKAAFGDDYDEATIKKWLRIFFKRFFQQQFKRSCLPDGPKVGSASLSPRGDWRMPSDASAALWLKECDEL